MQGVCHIDAVPPVAVDGEEHDISRLRQGSDLVQDRSQRRTNPFGDIGPALLASDLSDLAANRKTLEVGEGKRSWPGDHSINRKPPVREPAGLMAFEEIVRRRGRVS